jgi:hypothetical protein
MSCPLHPRRQHIGALLLRVIDGPSFYRNSASDASDASNASCRNRRRGSCRPALLANAANFPIPLVSKSCLLPPHLTPNSVLAPALVWGKLTYKKLLGPLPCCRASRIPVTRSSTASPTASPPPALRLPHPHSQVQQYQCLTQAMAQMLQLGRRGSKVELPTPCVNDPG